MKRFTAVVLLALVLGVIGWPQMAAVPAAAPVPIISEPEPGEPDRSPVDVLLTKDEQWLVTANQTSGTVSLVNVATGKVAAEIATGEKPSALAFTLDEKLLLVSNAYSGDVTFLGWDGSQLTRRGSVLLRFEPRGIAMSPDGKLAYVALTTGHAVAVIDIARMAEAARIPVGKWPRYLALSQDGKRLAVGVSGDGGVSVVDTEARKLLFTEDFVGMNVGQMQMAADGLQVYFPFMLYRRNPVTRRNIELGWVLASRLGRVRLDRHERRDALSLDPDGQAVSDPHGLAITPDEKTLVMSASGTHELLIFQLPGLPFQALGGTDHIPAEVHKDPSRFFRLDVGGRPMFIRYARDGKRLFVANYLLNAVQEVDVPGRKVVRTIKLGGPPKPSLARLGEEIFYDARRSHNQWYSCHSCHYDGHVNAQVMDTRNDGRNGTFKTVLTLRNVTNTGPWTWHGWQKSLDDASSRSITETMLGRSPTKEDVQALAAFMETLKNPPNPHRLPDGKLTEVAQRGKLVFESEKAGCVRCHTGPDFTDNMVHIVGLESREDRYRGFNTPSLVGVHDRAFYLHDGRASTLEEVLKGPHNPAKVTRKGELTAEELKDLIAYLKSL